MRTNSFNEQIGILIKNVLHEKADNYEAPDEVKERIDQKIKEREEKTRNCLG